MSTPLFRRSRTAAAALMAVIAVGCSPNPAPTASTERVVNVYSARHYDADQRLFKAFQAATGITPRVITAKGPELIQRLKEEGDQTSADVILMVDAGNLGRLQSEGLSQAVSDPGLEAAIPATLRDPAGHWFGLTKRYRVIAYAKDRVQAGDVDSLDDLASPRFKGRVCARSGTDIYNLSLLAARIEREGADKAEAWAAGVSANLVRPIQGGDTDQLKKIAGGVCDVALVNHYYVVRMQNAVDPADRAAGAKLAVSVPDQTTVGAPTNISGAAISAYTKHKPEAVALIAFLASAPAQAEVAALNDEFPIAPTTALPAALQALGAIKEDATPMTVFGARQSQAQTIFEKVGWR